MITSVSHHAQLGGDTGGGIVFGSVCCGLGSGTLNVVTVLAY